MTIEHVTERLRLLLTSLPSGPLREAALALAARPGKLLRPRLLITSARLGDTDPDRVVRLAVVTELLHLASLLHDDVVDKAVMRRGGPSAHVTAGAEQAMLAGLAVFALAGTEAATLGDPVARAVSQTIAGVSYGEMLDVERAFDIAFPVEDYVELVQRKTGDLFRLCCLLGAVEARLDGEQVRAAGEFGSALGVAFQIADDCLEMEPGKDRGKPAATDHALGLFGAPTLLALCTEPSGSLAQMVMHPGFGPADMDAVREQVIGLGGLEMARQMAADWAGRATAALDVLPDAAARDELAGHAATLMSKAQ